MPATTRRLLLFLTSLIFVPISTVLVIFFARGYRPDFSTGQIQPTGILVAHSYPDGAQVYVNSQLKSATNTTLNLPPGLYQVEIRKDGFFTWKKNVTIEAEIVTRSTAVLFPTVPTLKAVTTSGATGVTASPDDTRVVFLRRGVNQTQLYILDITESPLGLISREARLLTNLPNSEIKTENYELRWSPDSRQIFITPGNYLITISDSQTTPITANAGIVLNDWNQRQKNREADRLNSLQPVLRNILATASASLSWSPRENKLLYTATASASLSESIKRPLPGSSTQPQNRLLNPGGVYVYDIEEDRNFLIDTIILPPPSAKTKKPILSEISNNGWFWFPTSSHLVKVTTGKVTIIEYDGQNPTEVYAGPLYENTAIPYPSAKQLLILTDLTTTPTMATASANLYAVNLR
ncbi:MAG: PEGA domain protein [Candidatus Amesbacteria bacterium GW2011_GWB1_47_19]|nr:MAG: PEGA domain protein [Candidatus Amesbacteria bacterium GW2011_GWA1_44_24]KKU31509.1 MAG: PEGA domain protein [Candidatus Amesbacteria bacterium GW2011_GWC1_46_24]KKU67517.1 MAG: PEGA domain protein [Candidatus Amesbacteria bacterium GW2011_GWB1_47_19]OGD06198.1 MAG: hypothetical protein A2379_01320 [Candidatus Amesbacteria bacterium RIFOXYB1_FULL_47_13]HBC72529.1 hypothetical protein [Candidatus Amesbacteria bacterium]